MGVVEELDRTGGTPLFDTLLAQLAQPIFSSQAGKFPIPTAIVQNILRSLNYANSSSNPTKYGTRRLITVTVTNNSTGPVKTSVASSCQITTRSPAGFDPRPGNAPG